MAPGSTMITRIPKGRSSSRKVSLRIPNALLLAFSNPPKGMAMWAPTEVILTMRPCALRSEGRNAWVTSI